MSEATTAVLGCAIEWHAEIEDYVNAIVWSPDGRQLATAAVNGAITLFDATNGHIVHKMSGHAFGTTALAWQPRSNLLASAGQDGKIRWWDTVNGQSVAEMDGGAEWVEHVVWSDDARYLASAAGRKLRVWDASGNLQQDYSDLPKTISSVNWKPNSLELAASCYGSINLFNLSNPEPVRRFEWKGAILTMQWSPDGKFIATGDQDCTSHFWTVATGQDLQMWGYQTKVRELSWHPSSLHLAIGGGLVATVWDCSGSGPEGKKPIVLEAHEDFISALAYQYHGELLASSGNDGLVVLWQPHQGSKVPLAENRFTAPISQLAWSPDDTALAVGTANGAVILLKVLSNSQ